MFRDVTDGSRVKFNSEDTNSSLASIRAYLASTDEPCIASDTDVLLSILHEHYCHELQQTQGAQAPAPRLDDLHRRSVIADFMSKTAVTCPGRPFSDLVGPLPRALEIWRCCYGLLGRSRISHIEYNSPLTRGSRGEPFNNPLVTSSCTSTVEDALQSR